MKYPYEAPLLFKIWYYPLQHWALKFEYEVPNFGLLNPDFLFGREEVSFFYRFGNIYLGGGILMSQMNTRQIIHENKDLIYRAPDTEISKMRSDYKFGITFAHNLKGAEYFIILYPRLYPRVRGNSGGLTFDYTEMSAGVFKNLKKYSIFVNFLYREIYVYQFNLAQDADGNFIEGINTYSHYFGHSDLTFGAEVKILEQTKQRSFNLFLNIETGGRLYFRDVKNSNPFGTFNGQGYFTFRPENWLQGNLFSGLYSSALLVKIFFYQKFHPVFILKEGIELEILKAPNYRHGIYFKIGLEYRIF